MTVIGLTGLAGSGKSTVAQMLADHHGFTAVAVADAMREALLDFDPFVDNRTRLSTIVQRLGWDHAKRAFPEIRRMLQVFGTDVVRKRDASFWVQQMERAIMEHEPPLRRIVVSDVRFDNEALWVTRRSGRVYEVRRDVERMSHVSESGIDPALIFGVIDNRRTLEDLAVSVEAICAEG